MNAKPFGNLSDKQLYVVSTESLAGQLIAGCKVWRNYTHHDFVERLADGSLAEHCFRHYLVQDYLFLIHFSRAWALAAFKAQDIAEIRACSATVHALINEEIALHVRYCKRFGLSGHAMAATAEHPSNLAYTRFVMERGMAGDLLDLLVALAPCVIGYGEIGARLGESDYPDDHPYREWITTYAGNDYREVALAASAQLDRVAAARLGNRMAELQATFDQATQLEIEFWQMGLAAPTET